MPLFVDSEPIKDTRNDHTAKPDFALVEQQAQLTEANLVPVDYYKVRGTCGDERPRVGLLSGVVTIEVRPSTFGGPDIHALAISELTGTMPANLETGEQRLSYAKDRLNRGGLLSGGHIHCAANGGLFMWLDALADNPENARTYVRRQLREHYSESLMNEVVHNAGVAVRSGAYNDWNEQILMDVLDNEAGEAIECLGDVEHGAVLVARNQLAGKTVAQTAVYEQSVLGHGTYDIDDQYEALIDAIMVGDMEDAQRLLLLAAHAREAIIAAVAGAVPNELLYQTTLG